MEKPKNSHVTATAQLVIRIPCDRLSQFRADPEQCTQLPEHSFAHCFSRMMGVPGR